MDYTVCTPNGRHAPCLENIYEMPVVYVFLSLNKTTLKAKFLKFAQLNVQLIPSDGVDVPTADLGGT